MGDSGLVAGMNFRDDIDPAALGGELIEDEENVTGEYQCWEFTDEAAARLVYEAAEAEEKSLRHLPYGKQNWEVTLGISQEQIDEAREEQWERRERMVDRGIPPVSAYAHWNEDAEAVWYAENRYDMEHPEVFDEGY